MREGGDPRFRGFDGLRAIAILLVILWHGTLASGFPENRLGALRPVVMTGWAGVDLFFALSGFLITALILRDEERERFSLRAFYLRRALRILPVFYVVFLVNTFLLSGWLPSVRGREVLSSGSWLGLWPYATFWGNYFIHADWLRAGHHAVDAGEAYSVFWSLCVEEHFYLLWPLGLVAVRSWRARLAIAVAACVGIAVWRGVALEYGLARHQAIHTLSHFRIDSILWGAVGALVAQRWPSLRGRAWPRRGALVVVAAAIAVLVGTRALSVLPPPTPLGISLGLSLLAIFATLLLGEMVGAPQSWLVRALELRPVVWLGRISYAMYLVHFPAIDFGQQLLESPRAPTVGNLLSAYLLFVALSVAAASLLHLVVERPFLRLKDRLR